MDKPTEARGRAAVRERGQGRCEMGLPGCLGRADGVHHRLPAGAGGGWSPANLLGACGSGTTGCHGRTEHERTAAYADGRLVPRGTDPATVPVRLRHPVYGPALWLLGHDGLMRYVDSIEAPAVTHSLP